MNTQNDSDGFGTVNGEAGDEKENTSISAAEASPSDTVQRGTYNEERRHSDQSHHHKSSNGPSHRHSGSGGSSSRSHSSSGSSSHGHSGSGHSSHSEENKKSQDLDRLVKKYQVVSESETDDAKNSKQSKKKRRRLKKRRGPGAKVLRMATAVLAVLILAGIGTVITLNRIGKRSIDSGESVGISKNDYAATYDEGRTVEYNGKTYALNQNIITVACMGIDKEALGTNEGAIGTAGQADTILVAALNFKTGELTFISVPRDLMVEVNLYTVSGVYVGVENMQICLAYSYGNGTNTSCENVITSIERVLYGIPINFYAALDLEGISVLNDAIDGVTVTALETIGNFTEGETVTLYGDKAVQYVRERKHYDLNADTYRRARQIQYIKAFADKAVKYALNNFSLIPSLYNTAAAYSHTNITLSMATYLATTTLPKGVSFDNFVSLKGEMKKGEKFAEFYYDEQAALETVLEVFYKPIEG